MEVDAEGRKIRVITRKPPVSGTNITLTIDKGLQGTAEMALRGKKGAIVAMDPNDGQILALASSPAFDPNLFIRGIDRKTWQGIISSEDFPLQNRALSGVYPPGSVFKIIVALAGLEAGVIDPTKVVRFALQNATSVSGLMITTEALVTEKPEKKSKHATMPEMDEDMY